MLSLEAHHIADLRLWTANHLPTQRYPNGGRPPILRDSDVVTILLWDTIILHHKTLKDLHAFACMYLRTEFPRLPKYNGFLAHCHRVLPHLWTLLEELCVERSIRLVDSTIIDVCKVHRANRYRVAKGIASFGFNHQGTHFGFKLHLSVGLDGALCTFHLTPADVFDGQMLPELIDGRTKVAVGDMHYGGIVMREYVQERFGTIVIATPHTKQRKKLMASWQRFLLRWRTKIEAVNDRLKEHLHLVSSFPRSLSGYLLHYARILLGYQMLVLSEQ
jgi:Transposase DDE domain